MTIYWKRPKRKLSKPQNQFLSFSQFLSMFLKIIQKSKQTMFICCDIWPFKFECLDPCSLFRLSFKAANILLGVKFIQAQLLNATFCRRFLQGRNLIDEKFQSEKAKVEQRLAGL